MLIIGLFSLIITLAGLGYGLWERHKRRSLENQTEEIIKEIHEQADKLATRYPNTETAGIASSIAGFAQRLIHPRRPRLHAPIRREFYANHRPPLETHTGEQVEDPSAFGGLALRDSSKEHGPKSLVYGPHLKLPVVGRYVVRWRIRIDPNTATHLDKNSEVIRLNILQERLHTLTEKTLTLKELSPNYKEYELEFRYPNSIPTLEYRVLLLCKKLTVYFNRVVVESQFR